MIPVSLLVECAEGIAEGARQSMGNATCAECSSMPICSCGRSKMRVVVVELVDGPNYYVDACPICEPEFWE